MVQYKKDEIKDRIDGAALKIFAEKGYRDTKISEIGEWAGVSIGNIYRYYKSKDEIFDANVPGNFLEIVKKLLWSKISAIKETDAKFVEQSESFWLVNHEVIQFMVDHREHMLIVFHKNTGTKYENAKRELVEFLLHALQVIHPIQYGQFLAENKQELVIRLIYENLIHMTLCILRDTKNIEEVRQHLKSIHSYHMFGIISLFR
ncbi:hypothetical protein HNQ80_000489 [Anaerosolibacter carboniphilus]|uniref:HTH tetR-type domain-containing protein n=1 Tax=Anaerosolibacter carboniphilus TaxID=1417629 RepID=A0A841KW47_9FIRM|nr:TetR/AcrR family transcriptional regulator [Anaerosolibacter carboniphilus]MBB6214409.1 hypothetical protein [Anaerosolibacter carboniphilus]